MKEKQAPAGDRLWRAITRPQWLGQTIASLCWVASMLAYGLDSSGDWLQLLAASAWLLSSLASLAATLGNGSGSTEVTTTKSPTGH
ncbi:hypothetical protein [Parahalioglobus pacificus]|uniref:hypothetical protein n=1 Tax=Parahalioglobus pacificus TaxID=930806 RepID=UPI001E2DE15B|nr:hypothetical protein [Halioglobus pacificus]